MTVAPPAASALAASIPAGPAPTTATVSRALRRRAGNSTSRPARGLIRHDTGFVPSEWSMYASLQPMQ
ncbi:MAG TPA: hypothetical protein VLZ78_06990, partial [Terrimesophilobacter sp.]|nr:hypothetical protein [Terrimesophilobacter sp.]